MGITLLEHSTLVICNICGVSTETSRADGVVPSEWMTGHLWIDVSLSEQRQTPLCFCPSCRSRVLTDLVLSLAPEVVE